MPNLAEIIREVGELGARSRAVQGDIKGFANRAQRTIAQRRNWSFMHDIRGVTITTGSSSISGNTVATATVITTAAAHGRTTGDTAIITGSNSVPLIDGEWTVTVLSTTTFSIPKTVTTAGTAGTAAFRSAPLGTDFKCLSAEESPVSINYAGYNLPVRVCSRAEIERKGIWPWVEYTMPIPMPGQPYPVLMVYLQRNGNNQWTLNTPIQFGTPSIPMAFTVSAYYFPATLSLGTDTSAITEHGELCEALIAKTKELAYRAEDPTDKRAEASRMTYEEHISAALYSDSSIATSGRTLRM